jgi:peptidyl-tRNA hydrolase
MKQVMIVRTDLKMKKGKIAAQCCHGAIGAYKKSPQDKIRKWENEAYAKVVLKVKTLEELTELKKLAAMNGEKLIIGVITASPRKEIELQCKSRGADFFLEKNNDWQNQLLKIVDGYVNDGKEEEDDW